MKREATRPERSVEIIIKGAPGAGKSTIAALIRSAMIPMADWITINLDESVPDPETLYTLGITEPVTVTIKEES